MLRKYENGSTVGTCSLHCAAVELANTLDMVPALVSVADYDSKGLIDSDRAVWVMVGSKKGVDRQDKVGLCLQGVSWKVCQG